SANGPIENHAQRGIRVAHSEGHGRAAPHAATHEMGPLDVQMIQQALALCREMGPRHALDAAARLTALAAVADDAPYPPDNRSSSLVRAYTLSVVHFSRLASKPPGANINTGGPEPTTW